MKEFTLNLPPIMGIISEDVEHLNVHVISYTDQNPPAVSLIITVILKDSAINKVIVPKQEALILPEN